MLRARIQGTIIWECPHCKSLQKTKLHSLHGHYVECTTCCHTFVIGLAFGVTKRGQKRSNYGDSNMIFSDIFGAVGRSNVIYCDGCTAKIFPLALESNEQLIDKT